MKLIVEPPISRWSVPRRAGHDRSALATLTGLNAGKAVVATGHQAWLWHPGILTKDLFAVALAERFDLAPLHIVVDQDVHEPLALDLPFKKENRLGAHRVELAPHVDLVPTAMQGAMDPAHAVAALNATRELLGDSMPCDLAPIFDALHDLPSCHTLAQQVTAILDRLTRPWIGNMNFIYASDLWRLPVFGEVIERMLSDPLRCAQAYNRAVSAFPEAGIAALRIEEKRVELPLWAIRTGKPRLRVFADLSSQPATLIGEDRKPIAYNTQAIRLGDALLQRGDTGDPMRFNDPSPALERILAPKAWMLSALMRAWACDLFIHGKGGGIYDCGMEAWWTDWLAGEMPLSPMTVASADVFMRFDVPVAQPKDVERAAWRLHHLPHNIDRELALTGPDVARKRELLARMNDDRDPWRRSKAFAELHRLNKQFTDLHPDVIARAEREYDQSVVGLANRATAGRRDWCFAIYPRPQLDRLCQAVRGQSLAVGS